jgi:hypothetical protein
MQPHHECVPSASLWCHLTLVGVPVVVSMSLTEHSMRTCCLAVQHITPSTATCMLLICALILVIMGMPLVRFCPPSLLCPAPDVCYLVAGALAAAPSTGHRPVS